MAGIYLHIPFCKSRCVYCGFYSTTRHDLRQRYVDALCREMEMRSLPPSPIPAKAPTRSLSKGREGLETIYIGGGTPSQLTIPQLRQIFIYINKVYGLPLNLEGGEGRFEVTIECNPDDVTADLAEALSQLPVNRVSMGAQTFCDRRLQFLRRRHLSAQIPVAVQRLRQAGIGNISIDLMYGFPGETLDDWLYDIQSALALQVEHLSAYALMYEEGTPLYRLLQSGEVSEVDEELSRQMYYELKDRLERAGYEHYEISNFARPGFRSRHNSSYWDQTPYLGLGAAAHSFDGHSRGWNIANVEAYIAAIEAGRLPLEQEQLDADTRYNELVMTALRTCEGLDLSLLTPEQRDYCLDLAEKYVADHLLIHEAGRLRLSRSGLFVSDMVMSDLMLV